MALETIATEAAPETFVETLSRKGHRELWRLKYRGLGAGVQWEHLSSFHARLIAIEVDGDDPDADPIAVIAGIGSRPFTFRCPWRFLQPGGNHKGFYNRLVRAAGIDGICEVGKLSATIRAILQLTTEEEPVQRFEINQSAHRGKG